MTFTDIAILSHAARIRQRSSSARLRGKQIPDAFVDATIAAAARDKGTSKDRRRLRAHAITLVGRER